MGIVARLQTVEVDNLVLYSPARGYSFEALVGLFKHFLK